MLTDDAYTGTEQPEASIARDTIDGNPANIEADFIPKKAVGVTIAGSHIYWANPASGTIGRADIDGSQASIKPSFIAVPEAPEGACEEEVEVEEGVNEFLPSKPIPPEPRYVAIRRRIRLLDQHRQAR